MIEFRKFVNEHIELWLKWISFPHIKEVWFIPGYEPEDYIYKKITGNGYDYPFVIYINNNPIGYIQCSDLYAYRNLCSNPKGVFTKEEPGTFCIDLFIADENYLNKGYGAKIVKEFSKYIFKYLNAKKILIDPAVENKRAIRCYEKAGFEFIKEEFDGITNCYIMQKLSRNEITVDLAHELILEQFPEYANLAIISVEKQGHDNRTYRLGSDMLIRMPTDASYALKVPKEQYLLPKLAPYLNINIPVPIKMGQASKNYPYQFSIYKWLTGTSINLLNIDNLYLEQLAYDLAKFLKELENIPAIPGYESGQNNWWRGDHISVYDKNTREQIIKLNNIIDVNKAINLWECACKTKWNMAPVWIHGDFAIGNILIEHNKLSAIIDFGGMAMGDPACDLVIAWTYLYGKAREIFIDNINLDADTWLRAKAWALWKASFELCQIENKNSHAGFIQRKIIENILHE